MQAKEWLTPYVSGTTLEMGARSFGQIPGTILIDRERPSGQLTAYDSLAGIADGSVDAIVSAYGLEAVVDPWTCISEWRRVLKENGTLALVHADPLRAPEEGQKQTFTPDALASLLRLSGGFEIKTTTKLDDGSGWLCVATRLAVHEVRAPLGVLGAAIARAASQNERSRGELYFQLGTILLQAGDASLAERCFKTLLQLEPSNGEGLFGLGMCYGTMQLWPEALTELQRALSLDPTNHEARRWVALAKEKLGGKNVRAPQSMRI